jgi:hypothetical protein
VLLHIERVWNASSLIGSHYFFDIYALFSDALQFALLLVLFMIGLLVLLLLKGVDVEYSLLLLSIILVVCRLVLEGGLPIIVA